MKSGQVILGPMEPFPEANFSGPKWVLNPQLGVKALKMDGLFHGQPENPMNKWMIWGVKTAIFGSTPKLEPSKLMVLESEDKIRNLSYVPLMQSCLKDDEKSPTMNQPACLASSGSHDHSPRLPRTVN